jgi:hypothetical protein
MAYSPKYIKECTSIIYTIMQIVNIYNYIKLYGVNCIE